MQPTLLDIAPDALQPEENRPFPSKETDKAANTDLIGQSFHCQNSVVQVVSIDPIRPEMFVIVQDLTTEKRWSVPAGVIRLALGSRRRRKKAA